MVPMPIRNLFAFLLVLLALSACVETTGTTEPPAKSDAAQKTGVVTSNGRPISSEMNAGGVTLYSDFLDQLPQYLSPPPNDATLSHYFNIKLKERFDFARYEVRPSSSYKRLVSAKRPSVFLTNQLKEGSMLSYLYYEDGRIVHDGLAPQERFNFTLNDRTEFISASVGKSVVSYVVGHAICESYIPTVEAKLNDWPLISNTLYSEAKLIDVLNMRSRDQNVVTENKGLLATGRWFNNETIQSFAGNELRGTKPASQAVYNYNGLATNVAMNYVIFKTGRDWQRLLNKVFQEKVGIENRVFFIKQSASNAAGPGRYTMYATRYDYLRIAIAMLEDWQNGTCVGKYLRDIYDEREPKRHGFTDPTRMTDVAKSYGGQFHFDFQGMRGRPIFGLNGYNGQNVAIDMDKGRIVVVNAAHTNFDWRALVYNAIRNGGLPN